MDIDILLALQNLRQAMPQGLNAAFEALRLLGEATVLMAVVSVLLWGVDKRAGYFVMFNGAMGIFANQLIKITACVYRPWIRDARVTPSESAIPTATGYSFPSGHTALGVAIWSGAGIGLSRGKKWPIWLGAAISLLIGFSRMYAGVHTPQDVAVSLVLGAGILWAAAKILAWLDKNPSKDVWLLVAGLAAGVSLAWYAALKQYPLDYVNGELLVDPDAMIEDAYMTVGVIIGFFAGWFIERRFINFSVEGSAVTRIVRVAVGFAGLLGLKSAVELMFAGLGSEMERIVSTAVLMLYVTVVYPFIFTKLEKLIFRKR